MSDEKTLLEFPCRFPVKAMGRDDGAFDALVTSIVRRHAPDLGEGAVNTQPSRNGHFLAVTITITATGREQLDAIYRDLSDCEQVLMAL